MCAHARVHACVCDLCVRVCARGRVCEWFRASVLSNKPPTFWGPGAKEKLSLQPFSHLSSSRGFLLCTRTCPFSATMKIRSVLMDIVLSHIHVKVSYYWIIHTLVYLQHSKLATCRQSQQLMFRLNFCWIFIQSSVRIIVSASELWMLFLLDKNPKGKEI